jgi:hypothetical protein
MLHIDSEIIGTIYRNTDTQNRQNQKKKCSE